MRTAIVAMVLAWVLIGCEAQATPIASIATATPTDAPTAIPVQVISYGAGANIMPYLGDVGNIQYEIITQDSDIPTYDVVVAYGIYEGWQQAPQSHRVSLAINPNLAPLNDTIIRELIPTVIDSQAVVDALGIPGAQRSTAQEQRSSAEIRTTLANNGYPDGFELTLATESVPAVDVLTEQFAALSIDLRVVPLREDVLTTNQAHLVLFLWAQDNERADWVAQIGNDNLLDLWTLPISYLADESLPITFTENGIPIMVQ